MAAPNTVDLAIHFNNVGAQLMQQGQFINAIPYFQKALNKVKEEMDVLEGTKQIWDGPETLSFHMADMDAMNLEQDEFIFKSPIFVAAVEDGIDRFPFESLARFSFSLLYNLAVAMHVGGLGSQEKHVIERRIKKSLVFYELAYNMMQDEQIHGLTETMAIINNIAHVQTAVGNIGKSNQCYKSLLSIMVCVTDCGQQKSVLQFDRFYENALTALMPQAPVAEAA